MRPALLGISTALVLTGCTVGPDFTRPHSPTPALWKGAAPTVAPAADSAARTARDVVAPLPPAWWTIFGDPDLDTLQASVLAANQDLQQSIARVKEARALARLSTADLYPSLSHGGGYTRQQLSENRAGSPTNASPTDDYRTGFDLSYELDLWGRTRRSTEATQADAAATERDLYTVRLALTAEAARAYIQLRTLDAEKRVIDATLALRHDALALLSSRHQAGLINELDVTRARTELANVEAELHAVSRSRARLEHALAVLCGETPAGFAIAARTTQPLPPTIPAGLPSDLLERRPDIAAAEERLHAATARIGVAKADFFPRISLTAAAGFASSDLNSLIRESSEGWSFGPSVYLPLFDGGRNRANLTAAEARREHSFSAYRATVLNAFREVEDALSDLGTLAAESAAVNRSLIAARDTAALALERYERGLTSYLEVVDAQRGAFAAERHEAQLRGQHTIATIFLAKALGGGWDRSETFAVR